MKKIFGIMVVMLVAVCCLRAEESRTWTSVNGDTLEGTYEAFSLDSVKITDPAGKLRTIPLDQLIEADRKYVILRNPPKITIDYRESASPKEFIADPWYSNGGGNQILNHPIKIINAEVGALIKQASTKEYPYELTVEMYFLTEQRLDPDKYHIMGRSRSKPFKLSKENKFRYVFTDPNSYQMFSYDLYSTWPRGETPSRYLILVRDERGEVIAHEARGEWLYKNLDKLQELPVGSWINDKCIRVHPTSPPRTRRGDGFQV